LYSKEYGPFLLPEYNEITKNELDINVFKIKQPLNYPVFNLVFMDAINIFYLFDKFGHG